MQMGAMCDQCPLKNEKAVYSDGPQGAEYAVVGEAPGRREISKGLPFIGPSGKLLNATLEDAGLNRSEVFSTNTVLCRPPGKGAEIPNKAVECCRPRLQHEIASLPNLKRVLATGNTAATEFLNYKTKITRDRIGQPRFSHKYGVTVVPTIHPAVILRTADHFPTFVRDVHKLTNFDNNWHPPNYEVFNEPYPAKQALVNVPQGREIAVDIEITVEKDNSFQHPETLICVGIALDEDNAIIIERDALKNESVRCELAELLDRTNVVYHNGKFDVGVLWQQFLIINMEGAIYGDTMLASYCLDERPGHHSLDELSQDLLGSPNWKQVTKQYDSFEEMPPEVLDEYNAYDVCNTLRLWAMLRGRLVAEELDKLHDNLCMISEGLIKIENAGINVDTDYLNQLDLDFSSELSNLESELLMWVQNPRSWQQVMFALYSHFGVETPSTDKEHLTQIYKGARDQGIDDLARFTDLLLQHRKSTKLLGTYIRGIRARLTEDNRIKTNLLLHSSTTGRTSSRNPNLQNCYSDDTQVLTDQGFVYFCDLENSHKVATYYKDGSIGFELPEEYTSYYYEGDMVHLRSDYMDLLVTPEHKIYSEAIRQDSRFFERAKKWNSRDGTIFSRIMVRAGHTKSNHIADKKSLQLAIICQADGYYKDGHYKIEVKKERKKNQLIEALGEDRIKYKNDGRAYAYIETDETCPWLEHKPSKNIKPELISYLCKEDLEFFIDEIMKWDGDYTRNKTFLQTNDKVRTLEAVQLAAVLSGKSTNWYIRDDTRQVVNIHPKAKRYASRIYSNNKSYSGMVYCVTVSSGAIIVRRNGQTIVCGNCPRESGIRNVFIPDDEDHVLVYADFDNIEGRITAVLADDSNLQRLFAEGTKPHKAVAKVVFGEDYSSEDYVLAKSVTHGVNYMRTPHGIAEGLDIPLHKATKVYNEYMKMAPGLPEWHNKIYKHVIVEQEDIVTPFGRKRRFPLITKENMYDVWREAVAFEPQSIASDLNTFAGIYLHKAGYDVRLFIHDALLLQVPRENAQDQARNISELMQQSAEANFPWGMSFPVEAESGYRWGECE
jgi:uracil-DNA glycosylase family 4